MFGVLFCLTWGLTSQGYRLEACATLVSQQCRLLHSTNNLLHSTNDELLVSYKQIFDFHFPHFLFPGAPSVEVLDSAVSAMDHPFLRAMHTPSTSSPQPLAGGNEGRRSSLG